jgi:hypothetical protein
MKLTTEPQSAQSSTLRPLRLCGEPNSIQQINVEVRGDDVLDWACAAVRSGG